MAKMDLLRFLRVDRIMSHFYGLISLIVVMQSSLRYSASNLLVCLPSPFGGSILIWVCLGAQYTMKDVQASLRTINGQRLGTGQASLLDPYYLFKGKLRAAATRSKYRDAADMRWLADRYGNVIQARKENLNLQYIGLAMKRYPELELLFRRLEIDLTRAREAARDLDPSRLPAPAPGDVQRGLLG